MNVNGFQIKEAMRGWVVQKDISAKQFNEALFAFDEEKGRKPKPQELAEKFATADRAVAELETLQQLYNSTVEVEILQPDGDNLVPKTVTLALAVKLVGGAGRLEKMWRNAASDTGRDRYSYRQTERSRDSEYAQRTMSVSDCLEKAKQAATIAGSIRGAISKGNMTEITIGEGQFKDFDPSFLE